MFNCIHRIWGWTDTIIHIEQWKNYIMDFYKPSTSKIEFPGFHARENKKSPFDWAAKRLFRTNTMAICFFIVLLKTHRSCEDLSNLKPYIHKHIYIYIHDKYKGIRSALWLPDSSDVNVADVSRFAFQLKHSFTIFFFFNVKTQMKCTHKSEQRATTFSSSGSCLGVIVLALGRPNGT